jgi:hypothetical protein
VSYHETVDPVDNDYYYITNNDSNDHQNLDIIECNDSIRVIDNSDNNNSDGRQVTFSATVMASVISEATLEANNDQFIGASFAQLQDVDDEPDIVCYAHVAYELDDEGDEPIFVTEANNNAEVHNEMIRANCATYTGESDPTNDFELMIYHMAHRVLHKDSQVVGIFHYEPGRPDFITHTYGRNIPESIIDYSDALRFKFKCVGIHDTKMGMAVLFKRIDAEVMSILKHKFNDAGVKGINTSTVKFLREETIRSLGHKRIIIVIDIILWKSKLEWMSKWKHFHVRTRYYIM